MTVESYYVIAIATLSDWLKRFAPVLQPMRIKTRVNNLPVKLAIFTCVSHSSLHLQVAKKSSEFEHTRPKYPHEIDK